MFLPAKLAAGVKMYNTAKTVSTFAKKYGITETDVVQSLTSNIKHCLIKTKKWTSSTSNIKQMLIKTKKLSSLTSNIEQS